jgi:probable rRNA maturation factor
MELNAAMRRAVAACLRHAPCRNPALLQLLKTDDGAGGLPGTEMDASFVDDAEIAALNTQYRGKPRPTDVLSFSQNEGEEFPTDIGAPAIALGDLLISIETAARQAEERHHDLATEVTFLAVHGTLHLLGYDHGTSAQRRAMWQQQEAIVERLQASHYNLSTREEAGVKPV